MKYNKQVLCALLALMTVSSVYSAEPVGEHGGVQSRATYRYDAREPFTPDPYANETKAENDARMAWFREARFGLFIHWGPASVAAGNIRGRQAPYIGGWTMLGFDMPKEEYKAYGEQFIPNNYDPVAWAKLAKRAGTRYMVLTAKHHDGFALWDSAVTEWDIADTSPYGKDLVGPLVDAMRAEDIKIGLYYSHSEDWWHPGGGKGLYVNRMKTMDPELGPYWDEAQIGDFNEYLDEIAVPQVAELLGRYQPDLLWWDIGNFMEQEHTDPFLALLRGSPGIIHNHRLSRTIEGDIATAEQNVPPMAFKGKDSEICVTMNDLWHYNEYNHNWKSTTRLIQTLCDIVGKGGNFLLNIGPKADGTIPQPSIERLEAIGDWMDVYSESIYGTTASPFYKLPWGSATKKVHNDGTTIYVHIFDWPEDGKLVVPGLKNTPSAVSFLDDGTRLKSQSQGIDLVVDLPGQARNPHASVIKLEVKGDLDVIYNIPTHGEDGSITIPANFVDIQNRGVSPQSESEKAEFGDNKVENWRLDKTDVSWTFKVTQPGTYRIFAEVAAEAETALIVGRSKGEAIESVVAPTNPSGALELREFGEISFPRAGDYTVTFWPVQGKWTEMDMGGFMLKPVE